MAGTLFGLPLSQQLDEDGDPHSGALLYVFAALTSTPADTFADSGLTTLNAFPMEADASGRIPQFWVNDGSYRARLTTAGGVDIFDEDGILAIGPSVASSGGGGGGTTTDSTAIFSTGDMKWRPTTEILSGWVKANGTTIGSPASGRTQSSTADQQALFAFLWNNFSDTLCPVVLGRGASATADFAANKAIATLDMRGFGAYGLDDMGSAAAGRLVTGTPTAAGSSTGAEKTTIAQANLPNFNLSLAGLVGSVGTSINLNNNTDIWNGGSDGANVAAGGGATPRNANQDNISASLVSGAVSFGGTLPLGGSGTAATTISPGRLGTWLIKL